MSEYHCMVCNVSSNEELLVPTASGGTVVGLICGKCARKRKVSDKRNTFLELFSDDELLGFVVQLQEPGEKFEVSEIQRELEFRKQRGIKVLESNSAAIAKHLTRAAIAAGAKT